MTYRGIARRFCPALSLALAIACQQADTQLRSESETNVTQKSTPAVSPIGPAEYRSESVEQATGLPRTDAHPVMTKPLLDLHAPTPPQTRSSGAETWLDHVGELEPLGAEGDQLRELAILHPDSEVRKFALEGLADAEGDFAFKSFVDALEDNDSEVVLTAIEELKFLDDRAAIRPLNRLARDHPDEDIQEAAREAIEFLE